MRVNYQRDVKHTGTLDAAGRRKMTIDENSLQHLMSLLTDIYSDPDFAVIREYALNALDSHKAAGNDDPIMVELPNEMRPTYVVRDEGTGMSVDEVLNHLSKYGASTKRDTNEETGMLGIGFKAALTYTSQFTCTVVKDGVKAVVLVARDDDGVGSVQIVDTLGTDEPNGVEVQVPVSNMHIFNKKARWFFRFWEGGTVLVNGELPDPITGQWLDDDVVLVDGTNYYNNDGDYSGIRYSNEYVVMGNIPYPVDDSSQRRLCPIPGKKAIVWVPMGAVNFAPSREALTYTDLTKETLEDARWWIKTHLLRIAQNEIDACTDYKEAFKCANKWWSMSSSNINFKNELTYHNQKITQWIKIPGGFRWRTGDNIAESCDSGRTVRFDHMVGFQNGGFRHAVHVVNHTNKTWAGINRKKFHKYCEKHDIEVPSVVWVYPGKLAHPWMDQFDNVTFIDFDDISDVSVTRGSAGGGDESPYRRVHFGEMFIDHKRQYDESRSGFRYNFVDDIPSKTRVIYFSPTELNEWSDSLVTLFGEDTWYMLVNKNRWSKFLREEAPHAEHLFDAIEEEVEEVVDGLTKAEMLSLQNAAMWKGSVFSVLDADDVADPQLTEFIRIWSEADPSIRRKWQAVVTIHRKTGQEFDLPELPEMNFLKEEEPFCERYPLVDEIAAYKIRYNDKKEELLHYVNASYRARSHERYLEGLQVTQPDDEE